MKSVFKISIYGGYGYVLETYTPAFSFLHYRQSCKCFSSLFNVSAIMNASYSKQVSAKIKCITKKTQLSLLSHNSQLYTKNQFSPYSVVNPLFLNQKLLWKSNYCCRLAQSHFWSYARKKSSKRSQMHNTNEKPHRGDRDNAEANMGSQEVNKGNDEKANNAINDELLQSTAVRLINAIENNPHQTRRLFDRMDSQAVHQLLEGVDASESRDRAMPPTFHQLQLLALSSCIPFIGFGFVDNFIMIVSGDLFDTTLCVLLSFSTMAAAAFGNLISDVLGIALGRYVEALAANLGFPASGIRNLSRRQLELPISRRWSNAGSAIGIAIGCILGMIPLLFIDTEEANRRKRQKAQEELFGNVMKEMAGYLQAEKVILYLVDIENSMFRTTIDEEELTLPLDAGIPGQVYSIGQPINWIAKKPINNTILRITQDTALTEQDSKLKSSHYADGGHVRQVLGAPVFGVTGEIIGVVEVVHPLDKDLFTKQDKEFLIAMCSHIAIEIEGKHHITNILKMCRKQVASRNSKLYSSPA